MGAGVTTRIEPLGKLSRLGGFGSSASMFNIDIRFERLGGSEAGAGAADGAAGPTELGRWSSLFGSDVLKAARPMSEGCRGADAKGPNGVCVNGGREKGDCTKLLRGGVIARSSMKGLRSCGGCKG